MILLASKSSGRLATLRAAGVEPLVRVSAVDEDTVLHELADRHRLADLPAPSPSEQVQALAQAKALDVAAATDPQEAEVVVGCDSMLEIYNILTGHNIADELCPDHINGAGLTGGNIGPIFHLSDY